MIDLHIHILPGVDDGAVNLEESVRMARMAVEDGVTALAVTPHCNLAGRYDRLWARDVRGRVQQLQQALDRRGLPLRLYPGMEIYGLPNAPELLRRGRLLTLNDSRYPLVEFPMQDYGEEMLRTLDRLLRLGYRPVVAHPERYRYVQARPELLNLLWEMGCLLQVNRGSLLGRFGPGAEWIAWQLLERELAAVVASDAHGARSRLPRLREVRELIAAEFSEETARRLLWERPGQILRDEPVCLPQPRWF